MLSEKQIEAIRFVRTVMEKDARELCTLRQIVDLAVKAVKGSALVSMCDESAELVKSLRDAGYLKE